MSNRLSKTIENSSWFFLSWKQDPTIQSMLTMLDAIHKKFADKKEYSERLINIENPIITFQFLNLKDFKLTDDLYIKMNSRGKPLTSFENFKAKFEQYLESVETERKFKLDYSEKEKDVSLKEYFSYKIDTKWADLFWNYKDTTKNNSNEIKNTYDDELRNFIRVIFANQYAVNVKIVRDGNTEKTDDNLEFLLETRKRNDYNTGDISFYKYKELEALSSEGVFYLIDAFDALENGNDKIKNYLSANYKFYFDEEKVFKNALEHKFDGYPERLLFHAYIRFLIENKNNKTGIEQWMKVIHNLANNTIFNSTVDFTRAIKSIEKISPNSNDILTYLKNNEIEGWASWQILEEKIKAHLITRSNYWKEKIESTEKHDCFDGQIGFILEFSEILDYYEKNKNCNWTEDDDKNFSHSFENYADKSVAIFENRNSYNSKYVWERAVLSKGDYLVDTSSWRKNLLTTDSNTRDFSWKRFLRLRTRDEQNPQKQFVKQVLDDVLFDKNDIEKSLEKICESKTNTWRDYFIDCPKLIECCQQGFIRFINEHDILLLGQSQMNHWHAEMYTLFLWYKFFENRQDSFNPFESVIYDWSKSTEDEASIFLNNFCHDRIYYEIRIYYCNDDKLPNPYEIKFAKSKGDNAPDRYDDTIKSILINLDFEWREDYSGYFFTSENSNTLMEKLKLLCEKFSEL